MAGKEIEVITVGKLDAARRQLATAITLWFSGGDPVSIRTLAYAAYDVIHAVSKRRNPDRRDLLFNSALVRDECRREWGKFIKGHANFFKHADKDGDAVIEFRPIFSEMFILFSIAGIKLCGERQSDEESAFMFWFSFHEPHLLTDEGGKMFVHSIPIEKLNQIRSVPKKEFLQAFLLIKNFRQDI